MRCPRCGGQVISLLKYGLRDWANLKCAECRTPLRQSRKHRMMAYGELAFGLLLLASFAILVNLLSWSFDAAFVLFLTLLIVVELPYTYVAWRIGDWEIVEQPACGDHNPRVQSDAAKQDDGRDDG